MIKVRLFQQRRSVCYVFVYSVSPWTILCLFQVVDRIPWAAWVLRVRVLQDISTSRVHRTAGHRVHGVWVLRPA